MRARIAAPRGVAGAVLALALLALAARVLIITQTHGGNDLKMYTYFSRLPLHGINPYTPPHGGMFPGFDSNNPPFEVALYTGLLWLHDSPATLRVLFALADVAVVLLVGLCFARTWRWRLSFAAFYALNPFGLVAWTGYAEDKTLLFLGICVWMLALERGREWTAWLAATALATFKFLGTFAVPAQALETHRNRGRWVLLPLATFAVLLLLSNLPWFPHSLEAYSRRNDRLTLSGPLHASPMLLLVRAHVYASWEPTLLTALAILGVLGAFAARRLDMREALALSLFGGSLFLPDDAFNRLLLIALPVMLLLEFSALRWLVVWLVSGLCGLGAVVATRGVPHWLSGIGGPLRTLFGYEGTARHAAWMTLLPAVVLALYLYDRRAGRAPLPPERAALAAESARSNAVTAAS